MEGHRFWYQSKAHEYDFLLVINTNLPPVLHRFRDIAVARSKIDVGPYLATSLAFNAPDGGVPLGRSLRKKISTDVNGWPR